MSEFIEDDIDDELLKAASVFMNTVGNAAKLLKPGESTQVPCDCGGTLTIGKSPNNGHIHAHCDKCDKALMQ
jgi:hypothetical protein